MKVYFLVWASIVVMAMAARLQAQTAPPQSKQATQAVSFENDLRKLFANDGTLNRGTNMMMRTFDNRAKTYEGSPYVFPQWLPAAIHLKDGYVLKNIPTKIDVYQSQELMIWRQDTGDSLIVDATAIDYLVLEDTAKKTKHVFKRFPVGDKLTPKFCEVLQEGPYSVLAYHTRTFLPSDIGKAQSTGRYYDKYVAHVEYYIVGPDKTPMKIKKNRKSLLKALPPHQGFEAYLANHPIDFDNREQIAAAIAFYNSLFNQSGHKN
ncbi:MAG: hypothetical protein RMJ87_07225 [Cytophagales bacterium]|nr:hypothetical protein [Bernardetiaceae bacterium]MDW8204803.1 hypothetical protein [Cytophagales bacterium]